MNNAPWGQVVAGELLIFVVIGVLIGGSIASVIWWLVG